MSPPLSRISPGLFPASTIVTPGPPGVQPWQLIVPPCTTKSLLMT
jgi:hypothetical protein